MIRRKNTENKPVVRKIDGFVLSPDGDCALSRECFTPGSKRPLKLQWCNQHTLFLSDNGRVFAKSGITFMDSITGTLYRNGRCLSSDVLMLGDVSHRQKKCTGILLKIKGEKNVE